MTHARTHAHTHARTHAHTHTQIVFYKFFFFFSSLWHRNGNVRDHVPGQLCHWLVVQLLMHFILCLHFALCPSMFPSIPVCLPILLFLNMCLAFSRGTVDSTCVAANLSYMRLLVIHVALQYINIDKATNDPCLHWYIDGTL